MLEILRVLSENLLNEESWYYAREGSKELCTYLNTLCPRQLEVKDTLLCGLGQTAPTRFDQRP